MNLVWRYLGQFSRIAVAIFLALALSSLPGLLSLCTEANAAGIKHDCCQGKQTCHRQLQRSPCCEYHPSPGGQPFTQSIPVFQPQANTPALTTTLPRQNFLPQLAPCSEELLLRAQAPPLYLQKQSLLC